MGTDSNNRSAAWRKDIEVGVLSHVGMVRSENQDHYAFFEPDDDQDLEGKGRILVVCDGMGGHNGGTVASRTTVETMLESFRRSATHNLKRLLGTAIDKANDSVRQKGMKDPSLRNMGTTCVVAAVRGDQVQVAHIGDSRAYVIRDGEIEQITRDHTYINDLIEIGLLTPEKAKSHPERNIITRCVGMGDVVQVDYNWREAKSGDVFVLCSDGLFNHVEDAEICDLASQDEAQVAAQQLVDLANSRGGEDNITVGIFKILEIPQEFEDANRAHPVGDDSEDGIATAETPTPVISAYTDTDTPAQPIDPATMGSDITALHPMSHQSSPSSVRGWMILLAVEAVILIILQLLLLRH